MKRIILLILIILPLFIYSQLTVINPGLEGSPPAQGQVPIPWTTCMPFNDVFNIFNPDACTPDTQPGVWGVTTAPNEGNSYIGLGHIPDYSWSGTGLNSWQEGFSQELSSPMVANGCPYIFTIDLANGLTADPWNGTNIATTYGEIRIFGGFDYCSEEELLWSSGSVEDENWQTYTVEFIPSNNYSHILFECFKTEENSQCGYLLADNITTIVNSPPNSDAGPNVGICINSTNLNGNILEEGELGTWSILSGNAVFQDINNPNTLITGLNIGQNIFEWTVSAECTKEISSSQVIITVSELELNSSTSQLLCFGDDNGSIDIDISGGIGIYNYLWSNGQTTQNINNLIAGTYSITATDENGCQINETYILEEPNQLNINLESTSFTELLCSQDNNGIINTQISGGTSPYTYLWSNGATTQNISNLSFGNYMVTITDFNGCQMIENYNIIEPTEINLTIDPTSFTNLLCFDDQNGFIDTQISGGTPPYTYLWSNNETTQNISNLNAGNYSVTITDFNNCQISDSYIITEPSPININLVPTSFTDLICFGDNNGFIDTQISGGTPPYTYLWSNSETIQNISNLDAGNYSVTITDFNQCEITENYIITQPIEFSVDYEEFNISCNGASDGVINLTVNGPGNYTYLWNNGLTSQNVNNLTPGVYNVDIVSDLGCGIINVTSEIIEPPPLSMNLTATSFMNLLCFNDDNGNIDINISGGTAPYTYLWSNNAITQNINNLSAGNYSLTVTDNNNCIISENYTITEPSELVINLESTSLTSILCFADDNGNIEIEVSGGTGTYLYDWSNGESSEDINNLLPNEYSVLVTDINGCEIVGDYIITEPPPLNIDLINVTDLDCFDNAYIDFNITGGTGAIQGIINTTWGETLNSSSVINEEWYFSFSNFSEWDGYINITATDANGCIESLNNIAVQSWDDPVANFDPSTYDTSISNVIYFQDLSISEETIISWEWDFGDNNTNNTQNPSHSYSDIGQYEVCLKIQDENQCESEICKLINIYNNTHAYIPDIFTKNNDNINEIFLPIIYGLQEDTYEMLVYDRWGKLMFSTNNHQKGWDGTYKSYEATQDVYSYRISYIDLSGNQKIHLGKITLAK